MIRSQFWSSSAFALASNDLTLEWLKKEVRAPEYICLLLRSGMDVARSPSRKEFAESELLISLSNRRLVLHSIAQDTESQLGARSGSG